MGCLGNSKTEDQRNEEKAQREANKKIEKQLQKDKQIYRATHRLLLLGEFHERNCVFICLDSSGPKKKKPQKNSATVLHLDFFLSFCR